MGDIHEGRSGPDTMVTGHGMISYAWLREDDTAGSEYSRNFMVGWSSVVVAAQ